MSNYYAKNLDLLRNEFNNIYEVIHGRERDSANYILSPSKNQLPNLLIKEEGEEDRIIPLHSQYDPLAEAEKWLKRTSDEIESSRHILMYGLGFGYYLDLLIKKYPDKKIYVFEPNTDIFLASMEVMDLTTLLSHPNIIVFGLSNENWTREQFINLVLKQIADNFKLIAIPYYRHKSKDVADFMKLFEELTLIHRGNLHTLFRFQEEWTKNIFLNLPRVISTPSVDSMNLSLNETVGVIVGSGPSLENDIDYLKKLKEHAFIVAAGSSIQALLAHGIKPHLIVSIDGSLANYKVFEDLNLTDIPFIYAPFIKYKIVENMPISNLWSIFIDIDTITEYLLGSRAKHHKFLSTSSVTGTVVQLLAFMGCKEIVLVGQDLSYPNDQIYAEGVDHFSPEHINQMISDEADEYVENVLGQKNRTSQRMLNTLRDIETLLSFYPEVTFINVSRKGAKIKGTTWKTMDLVYDELLAKGTIDSSKYYFLMNRKVDSKVKEKYVKHIQRLESIKDKVYKLKNKAERLLKNLDKINTFHVEMDQDIVIKHLVKVEKDWKSISESKMFEHIYSFIISGQVSVFSHYLPYILSESDMFEKAELIKKRLGMLVHEIIKVTPIIIENIDESIAGIEHLK